MDTTWSKNLKLRDNLDDLDIDKKIILRRISEKYDGRVRTGFIWLDIGTSDGLL
jgi:hypothetical protein